MIAIMFFVQKNVNRGVVNLICCEVIYSELTKETQKASDSVQILLEGEGGLIFFFSSEPHMLESEQMMAELQLLREKILQLLWQLQQ